MVRGRPTIAAIEFDMDPTMWLVGRIGLLYLLCWDNPILIPVDKNRYREILPQILYVLKWTLPSAAL